MENINVKSKQSQEPSAIKVVPVCTTLVCWKFKKESSFVKKVNKLIPKAFFLCISLVGISSSLRLTSSALRKTFSFHQSQPKLRASQPELEIIVVPIRFLLVVLCHSGYITVQMLFVYQVTTEDYLVLIKLIQLRHQYVKY